METIEVYQSTAKNDDPRSNGEPATLTLTIGEDNVRMHVTLKNKEGESFTVSNELVGRATFDRWKEQLLANTTKVK